MAYNTTNPCLCSCNDCPGPTPPTPCKGGAGCFCFCNVYVGPTDDKAVAPCGQVGNIDLLTYPHDFSVCGDKTAVLQLVDFDTDFFDTLTLGGSVLSWTIKQGTDKILGDVRLKASCGVRGRIFKAQIAKRDLCATVTCLQGSKCNECDGQCIPEATPTQGVDLTLQIAP